MSVYVGIDVHRKRSQVAVVDAGGEVLANRNVPNGAKPVLSVIGELPAGTPGGVRGRVRLGWLPGAAGGLRLRAAHGPPAAVQGDRLGAAEERQGRRRDPGAAAARGPAAGGAGSPRRRCAGCGPCCGTGRSWSGCGPCCATGSMRSWPTTGTADRRAAGCGPGRRWLASLGLPAVSREVTGDALALTDAIQQPIDRLDSEVRQRARSEPAVWIVSTHPAAVYPRRRDYDADGCRAGESGYPDSHPLTCTTARRTGGPAGSCDHPRTSGYAGCRHCCRKAARRAPSTGPRGRRRRPGRTSRACQRHGVGVHRSGEVMRA
jgi:hypothetical protein